MKIWSSSASKTPASRTRGQCRWCGNPVEWRETASGARVPLLPQPVPTSRIPQEHHWHVDNGQLRPGAHPRDYGTCRISHSAVCPALEHPGLNAAMRSLVTALAVHSRRQRAAGFVPAPPPASEAEVREPDPPSASAAGCRHVLAYEDLLRITPGPLAELRCVAAVDAKGERCTNGVFEESEGGWDRRSLPASQAAREPSVTMWVWSLQQQSWHTRARWMQQRCPDHADRSEHPEVCEVELVAFDPLRHSRFALEENPEPGRSIAAAPVTLHPCATPACRNSTESEVTKGWRCWQCLKKERHRPKSRRRWGPPSPS